MMNYFLKIWSVLLVLLLIIGCGTPQKIDNTAAISAANEQWMAAFIKGDAAAIAANYTEDTQVMPPNSEIVHGREAVQGVFQGLIDAGLKVKLETLEIEGHGDIAFEVGMADVIGPDGQTIDKSKYIVVWKMVGSEWKMYRDIWNSNMPLPQLESVVEED